MNWRRNSTEPVVSFMSNGFWLGNLESFHAYSPLAAVLWGWKWRVLPPSPRDYSMFEVKFL